MVSITVTASEETSISLKTEVGDTPEQTIEEMATSDSKIDSEVVDTPEQTIEEMATSDGKIDSEVVDTPEQSIEEMATSDSKIDSEVVDGESIKEVTDSQETCEASEVDDGGSSSEAALESTNDVNSPRRESLTRSRRQPKKFTDFDSGNLMKARKSKIKTVNNNDIKSPKKKTIIRNLEKSKDESVLNISESADLSESLSTDPSDVSSFVKVSFDKVLDEGCLLWVRMSTYAYWPCMIIADPMSGQFHKQVDVRGTKIVVSADDEKPQIPMRYSYHVRFFGPKHERSWTTPKNILVYEGSKKYLAGIEKLTDKEKSTIKTPKNKKRKSLTNRLSILLKPYVVKGGAQESWRSAVDEADKMISLPIADRLKKYGFFNSEFPIKLEQKKTGDETLSAKKKRKNDTSEKSTPKKLKAEPEEEVYQEFHSLAEFREYKKRETAENSSSSDQEDVYQFSIPKPNKNASRGYDNFIQKMRPKLKASHKGLSDSELRILMERIWGKMSTKQKMRYKTHTSLVKEEDDSKKMNKSLSPESLGNRMKIKIGKFGKFEASLSSSICLDGPSEDEESVEVKSVRKPKSYLKESVFSKDVMSTVTNSSEESSASSDDRLSRRSKGSRKPKIPSVEEFQYVTGQGSQVCRVCEKHGANLIACKGQCNELFHPACASKDEETDGFTCEECTTGLRTCFICKEKSEKLSQCTVSQCGKFYHTKCLEGYPTYIMFKDISKGVSCPLHACLTCVNENQSASLCKDSKSNLIKCIRCPVAYHKTDRCVGAGSSLITQSVMVCHEHFKPKKTNSTHTHVNVNWCFICSDGGSLICCESCPAAFHADCLNTEPPKGSFYCDDCIEHKHPHYGDIVWIKIGLYRWWPAVVCIPDELPKNILALKHGVGEFPVKFFGSYDYFWSHKGRTFLFHEGDKGSKTRIQSHLHRVFNRAVGEAIEAFKEWCAQREGSQMKVHEKINKKPTYKSIKVSKLFDKLSVPTPASEPAACECSSEQDHPCGEYSSCINRMMLIECNPAVCPAGDKCDNQKFEKRLYPDIVPFQTDSTGWGLHSRENIRKGEFVIEYVGEIINESEFKKRLKQMNVENNKQFYFLTLDKDRIIDAGPKGNDARFMNHRCQPNCETQKWTVKGDIRVGLFAMSDIPAFTELTFNYNLRCLGDEKIKCMCGAPNCSRYIGAPPKALPVEPIKKNKIKKRKKIKKEHEDTCFRCGDGGDLVLCDRKTCSKCYHLDCLNLKTLPPGKWDCPWHHCDICGKSAYQLCSICPNSFCRQHSESDNIKLLPHDNEKYVCSEHTKVFN